ncbi:MAG: hypothetical protein ACI87O_002669 [Planctomycetota bacterium]
MEGPQARFLGSEAFGLEDRDHGYFDGLVSIPMPVGVDTLLVNAAAAVLLYGLPKYHKPEPVDGQGSSLPGSDGPQYVPTQTVLSMIILAIASLLVQGSAPAPTWSNAMGELVHNNCTECHRPGQSGPFPLLTYADARRRAPMLAEMVEDELMPPWHPVEGHGNFKASRRMSAQARALFVAWADAGAPEGDPQAAPTPPTYTEEWVLGEPDMIVTMTEGYDVPADGPDIYWDFVVPLDLKEDVWVEAIELHPGAPRVLHHTLFSIDTKGRGRELDEQQPGVGFSDDNVGDLGNGRSLGDGVSGTGIDGVGLGGWAVGGRPFRLPMGLARRIPAGADLILRSHFHPSGKAETEITTLGLYFAKEAPTRSLHALQLPPEFGGLERLRIGAGERDVAVQDSFTLPVDTLAITVGAHAHFLAERAQLWVTPPDAERRSLFLIDRWAFDWQQRYVYDEPVFLPAGTRVAARVTYDNSDENPDNPYSPPRPVRWGLQSTDEMGSVTLALVSADEADAQKLARALSQHHFNRGYGVTLRPELGEQVMEFDAEGMGRVPISALPQKLRLAASFWDFDGDKALDPWELGLEEDRARGYANPGTQGPLSELALGSMAMKVNDTHGKTHTPLDVRIDQLHVLVFTTPDCPIAAVYGPELERIELEYKDRGVSLYRVHVGEDVEGVQEVASSHTLLLDRDLSLAKVLGATRTPEVALVGPDASLLYRGRINDLYTAVGRRRQEAGQHDLRLALEAALAGKDVPESRTKAVGCLLPLPASE